MAALIIKTSFSISYQEIIFQITMQALDCTKHETRDSEHNRRSQTCLVISRVCHPSCKKTVGIKRNSLFFSIFIRDSYLLIRDLHNCENRMPQLRQSGVEAVISHDIRLCSDSRLQRARFRGAVYCFQKEVCACPKNRPALQTTMAFRQAVRTGGASYENRPVPPILRKKKRPSDNRCRTGVVSGGCD